MSDSRIDYVDRLTSGESCRSMEVRNGGARGGSRM